MCRRTEEEVWQTVGLPSHRQFVGFFYGPVQAPTQGHPSYRHFEKSTHFNRLLRQAGGHREPIHIFNPGFLKSRPKYD